MTGRLWDDAGQRLFRVVCSLEPQGTLGSATADGQE